MPVNKYNVSTINKYNASTIKIMSAQLINQLQNILKVI